MKKIAASIILITFTLISVLQAAEEPEVEAMTKKLNALIIPKVKFQRTDIGRVVRILQQMPKEQDPEKIGVAIDLIDVENKSKITLNTAGTTLHKILRRVSEMAGLSLHVEKDGVALR